MKRVLRVNELKQELNKFIPLDAKLSILNNIKDAISGWLLVENKHGRLDIHEEKEIFSG